jgi:hypothetical protein
MKLHLLPFLLLLTTPEASAQSAIERHLWQEARSFEPISRTAIAITGMIALSGNAKFAVEGSSMDMTFENGATVSLTSEGASWRNWDIAGSENQTAEVFRLSDDPGPLKNNNLLCGGEDPKRHVYVVFFEQRLFDEAPSLNLAVFQSAEPPFDINSSGLCGTFTYEVGRRQTGG